MVPTNNGQSAALNLSNEQIQVLLTGKFGDGREFWYLRISRYEGAYEITQLLNKYPVHCYNYKV